MRPQVHLLLCELRNSQNLCMTWRIRSWRGSRDGTKKDLRRVSSWGGGRGLGLLEAERHALRPFRASSRSSSWVAAPCCKFFFTHTVQSFSLRCRDWPLALSFASPRKIALRNTLLFFAIPGAAPRLNCQTCDRWIIGTTGTRLRADITHLLEKQVGKCQEKCIREKAHQNHVFFHSLHVDNIFGLVEDVMNLSAVAFTVLAPWQ